MQHTTSQAEATSQQIQIQPHGDGTYAVNFPPACIQWGNGRFYAQVTESQLRELLNEVASYLPVRKQGVEFECAELSQLGKSEAEAVKHYLKLWRDEGDRLFTFAATFAKRSQAYPRDQPTPAHNVHALHRPPIQAIDATSHRDLVASHPKATDEPDVSARNPQAPLTPSA